MPMRVRTAARVFVGSAGRAAPYSSSERSGVMASTAQGPTGEPIRMAGGKLQVPDTPVIPFIEGDGTGPDIWRAAQRVFDAGVEKAYGGRRRIAWKEVLAGDAANRVYGENTWLPDDTVKAIQNYVVAIKGPLTTPV